MRSESAALVLCKRSDPGRRELRQQRPPSPGTRRTAVQERKWSRRARERGRRDPFLVFCARPPLCPGLGSGAVADLGVGNQPPRRPRPFLVGRLTLSRPSTLPESIISKAALAITGVDLRGECVRPNSHAQEGTTRETAADDQKNWSSIELMFLWGRGE